MFSKLKQWASLNMFEKDEDRRLGRILFFIILICMFASLLVLFIDLIWWDKSMAAALVLGCILQLIPFGLLLQKKLSASSFISVGIYILITTTLATIGQGIHDYIVMMYPIVIMFAGLTTQKRGLIFSTSLILLAFAWLILGEANGWFVIHKIYIPDWTDMFIISVLVMIAAWGVYILVSNAQYGLAQTWRELAERLRAEEALRAHQENLQALIENSDASIWSIDAQYRLIIGNALYHYNVRAAIGRELLNGESVLALELPQAVLNEWRGYYERALRGEKFSIQTQTRFKSAPLDFEYYFNPIRGVDGRISGVTVLGQDITERKRIEDALRKNEARFRSLFEQSHDAVFLLDLNGRYILTNQRAADMLGYTVEELAKLSVNDISAETEESDHVAERLLAGEHIPLYERLFHKKNGEIVHVEVNVELVRDENRNPMHIQSVARNITERKQAEAALNKSEEMYRLLAENISDVIWILDVETGYFRYVSPSVERLRGYTVEEVLAQEMSAVLTPDSLRLIQEKMYSRAQAYKDGYRDFYMNEVEQPCKDGSTVWTETTTSFHTNENTGHLEVYGVSRDITERKRLQDKLRNYVKEVENLHDELHEQAIRDPLTGLYNRRYMQDVFKREFSKAERENYYVSVIMLDMDSLKIINDTYGHNIGDRAIQTLASQLQSMTRAEDFCCRYGGDEFTIMLIKTNVKDAVKRVSQWREALNDHPMEAGADKKIPVKFTAGIASFPAHGTTMEEVINYADVALYRAKTKGRDCTVVFE